MSSPAKRVSAATALAVYGSWQGARVFLIPPAGAGKAGGASLRGGGVAVHSSAAPGALPSGLLTTAAGSITVGAAMSLASRRLRTSRTATEKSGSEAPAGKQVEKTEAAPPPPPPFDPAVQLGATEPFGFFDPLGFAKTGDEEGFRKLRIAEVKHGRVAMMAAVGAVIQHYIQFPGFDQIPKGLGAVLSPPGTYGFVALFLVSGALELLVWKDDPTQKVDSIGDYGNPLQLGVGDPLGESVDMKNRELNNGRAAMFAALGIIVAELVTGKDAVQQLG